MLVVDTPTLDPLLGSKGLAICFSVVGEKSAAFWWELADTWLVQAQLMQLS